jgi:hypothetical protein
MALIRRFEERTLEVGRRHQPTDATWTIVRDAAGETLLQIDTYGSDQRKLQGKSSQTIQLDRAGAEALGGLLRQAFPGVLSI